MTKPFLISIFCPDRPGLISSITAVLFDLGVNLGDANFAVLGEGAKFTAVCDIPDELDENELKTQIQPVPGLEQADIKISPFEWSTEHGPNASVTHMISLQGSDQPGLVARLTEVFIEYEANIVRLNTQRIPAATDDDQYLIRLSVWIPEAREKACLATIGNTASSMQMAYNWTKMP